MAEWSRWGEQAEHGRTAAVTPRPGPDRTLAVSAVGTLLVLVAFTTPLATLASTGADLGAGPGAQAWVLSSMSVVTALGARWLPPWISPRAQLVTGLVGVAAGQLALVGLDPGSSIARLLPGLLVAGANGVLNAALGRQAVASVPPETPRWAAAPTTPPATSNPRSGSPSSR